MAEAAGNQAEEREKLAQVLQEILIANMAEEEERLAKVRIEATEINVGTIKKGQTHIVPPGAAIVATFGRTKSSTDKNGRTTVTTPEVPVHEIDTGKVVAAAVSGVKEFDVDTEFRKLRSFTDVNQREDFAQLLYMNIGQRATVAQERIRSIAAQQAGVVDAQAALDKNLALDIAAVQTGKIRPGDTTIQTTNARSTFQAALTAANALETDLIKKDPEINKLSDYRLLLNREFQQIDKRQDKAEHTEAQFGPMTDARLTNARFALGLADNTTKIIPQVHAALKKDKALAQVLDAGKADMPRLLVDPDMNVRRYAYKIIEGMERVNLGLGPNDKLPGYITALEPLIADRGKLTSAERINTFGPKARAVYTEGKKQEITIVGEKAKTEHKTATFLRILEAEIEDTAKLKYQDIGKWTFTDPQFKSVVDTVKANSTDKSGKVVMSDGIVEIMKAELKNQDGSKMTPNQKIQGLLNSLEISMKNDKRSFILPSVENYIGPMSAEVRNAAMAAYVRSQGGFGFTQSTMGMGGGLTAPEPVIEQPVLIQPLNKNKGNTSDTGQPSLLGAKRG